MEAISSILDYSSNLYLAIAFIRSVIISSEMDIYNSSWEVALGSE